MWRERAPPTAPQEGLCLGWAIAVTPVGGQTYPRRAARSSWRDRAARWASAASGRGSTTRAVAGSVDWPRASRAAPPAEASGSSTPRTGRGGTSARGCCHQGGGTTPPAGGDHPGLRRQGGGQGLVAGGQPVADRLQGGGQDLDRGGGQGEAGDRPRPGGQVERRAGPGGGRHHHP